VRSKCVYIQSLKGSQQDANNKCKVILLAHFCDFVMWQLCCALAGREQNGMPPAGGPAGKPRISNWQRGVGSHVLEGGGRWGWTAVHRVSVVE
jgi:hypothetical protein